ncbi:hypothetical protein JOY44_00400 [Phormidium sp. CLA17]|uniref:HTH domain-containing protein n=1 Tax=Leptolyngbya sp. Cla-17 TaxID=2803751 RepID=UPI001491E277|nr:HTH domain-containing protein [Leptolyngbya sp. Cla-17]MBM0740116.1 hypothetical protein [Leptolyngbya sp. Cla-17]
MPSAITLELAKRGDATAIATILSHTLPQHYDATASVIRLGNYLSVFIETFSSIEQEPTVRLVYELISELAIDEISTVEINAQHRGDRAMLWTQTIEAPFQATSPFSFPSAMSNPAINLSSFSPERPAPSSATNPLTELGSALTEPSGALVEPINELTELSNPLTEPSSALVEPKNQTDTRLANEDWSSLQTVLQRPEIVAMMAMALLLVFWDAYMEWMEETETQSFSGRKLAQRLGVSSSTISRYKERTNFGEWSQTLDPEGIAWNYNGKAFVPREAIGEG